MCNSSDDDHGLPDVDKCNRRLHDDHEYSDDDREYDDREDNNGPYSDGQYDDTIDANDHDPSGKYDSGEYASHNHPDDYQADHRLRSITPGGITKTQEGLDEEWQEDDGDDTHTHTRVSGKVRLSRAFLLTLSLMYVTRRKLFRTRSARRSRATIYWAS